MFVRVAFLTESCAVFDVRPRKTPSTAEPPRTQVREPSRGGGRERERALPSHLVEREREGRREGERTEKERERENMKLT